MSALADQPAFPPSNPHTGEAGMTYRQWLAGVCLQGVIANPETAKALTQSSPANIMAVVAVTQADHLIAELEKKGVA